MRKFDWGFFLKLAIIIWAIFIFVIFFMKFDFQKTEIVNNANAETLAVHSETLTNNLASEYNIEPVVEVEPEPVCEIENDIVKFEPYYSITDDDRYVIEHIVAGEAGHEPLLGKMAVAQCILNAMEQDGLTVSGVRETYQYSGRMKENFPTNYPEDWAEVQQAVWCVFDNGEKVTEENILWFYSPANMNGGRGGTSSFHESQKFVIEIGGHRFFAPWN